MGFRSYIREFLVAILMLFRPSLPWCFPIRELSFEQKEQQEQQQQKEKVAKKSSFSMGFSIRELSFEQKEQQEQEQQQQKEKVAKKSNHPFLWVSEVTLGSFWSQF